MEAKKLCMCMNLGGDKARDSAAGVGVEIQTGSLAVFEAKKSGARDHRGIICRKPRRRCENSDAFGLQPRTHRGGKCTVACDAATENDSRSPKRVSCAPGFLNQRVDQRVLKSACNVAFVSFDI